MTPHPFSPGALPRIDSQIWTGRTAKKVKQIPIPVKHQISQSSTVAVTKMKEACVNKMIAEEGTTRGRGIPSSLGRHRFDSDKLSV